MKDKIVTTGRARLADKAGPDGIVPKEVLFDEIEAGLAAVRARHGPYEKASDLTGEEERELAASQAEYDRRKARVDDALARYSEVYFQLFRFGESALSAEWGVTPIGDLVRVGGLSDEGRDELRVKLAEIQTERDGLDVEFGVIRSRHRTVINRIQHQRRYRQAVVAGSAEKVDRPLSLVRAIRG